MTCKRLWLQVREAAGTVVGLTIGLALGAWDRRKGNHGQ